MHKPCYGNHKNLMSITLRCGAMLDEPVLVEVAGNDLPSLNLGTIGGVAVFSQRSIFTQDRCPCGVNPPIVEVECSCEVMMRQTVQEGWEDTYFLRVR